MQKKIAIIIGAGPAGLTAAYELLHKTDIHPIVYEATDVVGGICRTVNYKGNRIDIGGHRFFSKSDRVLQWWNNILPLQGAPTKEDLLLEIHYQGKKQAIHLPEGGPDPEKTDRVMLLRKRRSRIYFLRKFFNYPLSLGLKALENLGVWRAVKILWSYLISRFFPIRPEVSLRDFLINRFGKELYITFFRSYTEKVWGVPCHQIKAEWGAQRIKGLSLKKAILNQARTLFFKDPTLIQKNVETSLIERFMYPKYGPGQMWDEVARIIREKRGEIHTNFKAIGIKAEGFDITEVTVENMKTGEHISQRCDYFFSTMPVKELVQCLGDTAPSDVREVARGLMYRDFITVGVLLKKLKLKNESNLKTHNNIPPDNWIYIQERDVKVGRVQLFNNWSPYLVNDPDTVWVGLEYFCNEGDKIWLKNDEDLKKLAIEELVKMEFAEAENVLDSTVIRMPKAYPAYFGSYDQFPIVTQFTDQFENLFLIGRNGMHRYNNQDHSMLAAMVAVENILNGITTKDNIWSVNTEQDYHEEA